MKKYNLMATASIIGFLSAGTMTASNNEDMRSKVLESLDKSKKLNFGVPCTDFEKCLKKTADLSLNFSANDLMTNDGHLNEERIEMLRKYGTLKLQISNINADNQATILRALGTLTNLRSLVLDNTQITDEGLQYFKGLTNLEDLFLQNTQITGSGLKYLTGLKNLQMLDLSKNPITDEGLQYLAGLKNLQMLDLNFTPITDEGLKYFAGLTRLIELYLFETQITDEGLKYLVGLTNLEMLEFTGPKITDKGLKYLTGLRKLHYLDIEESSVTAEGAKKLHAHLPNTAIFVPPHYWWVPS